MTAGVRADSHAWSVRLGVVVRVSLKGKGVWPDHGEILNCLNGQGDKMNGVPPSCPFARSAFGHCQMQRICTCLSHAPGLRVLLPTGRWTLRC